MDLSPSQILSTASHLNNCDSPSLRDTVQRAILDEPLGSHEAVHAIFMSLPIVECDHFPAWLSLKDQLGSLWNVTWDDDCEENVQDRWYRTKILYDIVHEGNHDLYDLRLCGIINCPKCYKLVFGHEKPNEVFFCIATKAEKMEERNHMIFSSSLQELFRLCSCNEQWFKDCRRQFPDVELSGFAQREIRDLFTFVDVDLADWLLEHGLRLGGSCWRGVMIQKNPVPMLDWLEFHEPDIPDNYLPEATTNSCLLTIKWVLQHGKASYERWEDAATIAMDMAGPKAAEMFDVILRSPFPDKPQSFFDDLVKRIRDRAMAKLIFDEESNRRDNASRNDAGRKKDKANN